MAIKGCSLNTWKQKESLSQPFTWSSISEADTSIYLDELGERLIDEDEGDEESKDLLGEGRDVAHQEAALSCHDHQDDEDEPEADPHTARKVLEVVGLTELSGESG